MAVSRNPQRKNFELKQQQQQNICHPVCIIKGPENRLAGYAGQGYTTLKK